uniref:Tyrosine-protein kinase n=1 Tax=Panagrolaimus sp. PS1159 TaxID=55785 RepID=A0AC35FJP5_9BILA
MLTKKDKYSFIEQSFTTSKNQYNNLNLNQGKKCLLLIPVQSNSKPNNNKYCESDNYKEKKKLQSWDKFSKTFPTLNEENNDSKKRWKNKNTLNAMNKSTLSFHISAYENATEAAASDLFGAVIEGLKKEKFGSLKAICKQSFTGAFEFQNPFEFPRQQDGDQKKKSGKSKKDDTKEGKPKKEGNSITQNDDEVSITDDVRGADYYHGLVPRLDVEPLLKKEGDFLLRKTDNKGQIVLAISVFHNERVAHFMVNQDTDGTFYIEEHHEKNVSNLIEWHIKTKTPLSSETGCKLRTPIERPNWLLNHDSLKLLKKLGEGAFGEVYLSDFNGATGKSEVAVKTMRDEASRDARLKFMKEARLMRKFTHKHVVKIYGVAVHENPLMIIMEFCPGGSLLSYLRKNKEKLSNGTRLRFATEAADGLWYLERQKLVHRDIAARNCLLTAKNELKISDFGMSDEREKLNTEGKLEKVPIKWLAYETMQNKIYSHKTDVWSYGVLVYEIYADGSEPYPGWTNIQTRAKIVVNDYRMDMPKETPKPVAALVSTCWLKDPEKRPDFATIFKRLKELNKKEDSTMAKI